MRPAPFHKDKRWTYVSAETGELRYTALTRQYYEWDKFAAYGPGYALVREELLVHGEVVAVGVVETPTLPL